MNKMKVAVYVVALAALAACNNGRDGVVAPVSNTTSKLADVLITNSTDETSSPIAINDLPVTADESDETSSPMPV